MGYDNSDGAPAPDVEANGVLMDSIVKPEEQARQKREASGTDSTHAIRRILERAGSSYTSIPPPGSILTGKQEHCTKRIPGLNAEFY